MNGDRILVTCEHADHRVPRAYATLFASERAQRALDSHRGFDPGAAGAARLLARAWDAPLLRWTVTRLLVEVNRSLGHPRLFSEFSRGIRGADRAALLAHYYFPHRARVEAAVARATRRNGRVVHIGVHSFTPRLGSDRRNADVGLLYDPARPAEQDLCVRWQHAIEEADQDGTRDATPLRVRRNYPYRGSADGLTTALRRRFAPDRYLGIELEINQARLVGGRRGSASRLVTAIARALSSLMNRRL